MNDKKFKLVMGTTVFWMITVAGVTIAHMWFNPPAGVVTVEPLEPVSIDPLPPPPKPVTTAPVVRPFTARAPTLKTTYHGRHRIRVNGQDFRCLAYNLYYEARGEPRSGKIAVAEVTWNRVRSQRWGKTVCDVVFAERQFSWTNDLQHIRYPRGVEWQSSKAAATAFLNGDRVSQLGRPDHYHAVRVNPRWNREMTVKGRVGHHVFFASNR